MPSSFSPAAIDNFNAKGATIRALATGSGNTTTVEVSERRLI